MKPYSYLCAIAIVASSTSAHAAECSTGGQIRKIELLNATLLNMELAQAGTKWSINSAGGTLSGTTLALDVGFDGSELTLEPVDGSSHTCTLGFARHFKKTTVEPVSGDALETDQIVRVLGLVQPVAGFLFQLAVVSDEGTCPEGTKSPIQAITVPQIERTQYLVIGPKCLRVAKLVRDNRSAIVKSPASAATGVTVTIPNQEIYCAGRDCRDDCTVEPSGTCDSGTGFPPSGDLPARALPFKVKSLDFALAPRGMCPATATVTPLPISSQSPAEICSYVDGLSSKSPFRYQFCTGDKCIDPGEALFVDHTSKLAIKLIRNGGPLLAGGSDRVTLNPLKAADGASNIPEDAADRGWIGTETEFLAHISDNLAWCIPQKTGVRDQQPSAYITVKVPNANTILPVAGSWMAGTSQTCPEAVKWSQQELDALRQLFINGADPVTFEVRRSDSSVVYAWRFARSDRFAPRGITLLKRGSPVTDFDGINGKLEIDGEICIETGVPGLQEFHVSSGQIGMKNGDASLEIASFVTEQSHVLFKARDSTGRVCARITRAQAGEDSVRLTVDGSAPLNEDTLRFTWNGRTRCGPNECGSISRRLWRLRLGTDAARNSSHFDLGVWNMGTYYFVDGRAVAATALRTSVMAPLVDGGVSVFGLSTFSGQIGGVLPYLSLVGTEGAGTTDDPKVTNVGGGGIGGYASVCLAIHTPFSPRVCVGGALTLGAELTSFSSGVAANLVGFRPNAAATWMVTVGGGSL